MITNEKQIVLIKQVTNMKLIDAHKMDLNSPLRDIIIVTFASGEIRTVDLFAEMDVTNIDYWYYEKTQNSNEIILFKHYDVNKIANEIE